MSENQAEKPNVSRWAIQMTVYILILAACLFISAGRLDWAMGRIYIALLAANQIIVGLVLAPKNPKLLSERARSQGPRDLDRVLAGVMAFFGPAATLIVAGLDARFAWSAEFPLWIQLAGLVAAILGSFVTIRAMAANKFFYGIFRIDKDRGHSVASSGPYKVLRHPGYAGAILFNLATPLMLSSLWAIIPALLTTVTIVVRTRIEDRRLIEELDGYRTYAERVRFRLLPVVW